VVVHSMHKYQPMICINQISKESSSDKTSQVKIFTFPETLFFAVTSYQNQQISKLKIESNPFAKGFRETNKYRDSLRELMRQHLKCRQIVTASCVIPHSTFSSCVIPHSKFPGKKSLYFHCACHQELDV
ncbi:T-box transcription factor TBX20-like, partial [Limulus polyphemus]|uniref:T-box transcription factor TBX20-like n=1 Tax=Limulus polyphemus TaxID=6850 RepID=A0ABM1RY19_LIMPO